MYEIEYKGEKIEYTLIKSNIKNMYIHIKDGRVIVKVPTKLKDKYIQEFINKKAKWIYEKLKDNKLKLNKYEEIQQKDIKALEKIVKESIKKYTIILGVKPKKVRIKRIKYAWGSCSSKKNITINMYLANKDKEVIEYVVLHEMCHLIHMNHSKDFWSLIEKYMPQYKEHKNKLKQI